MHEHVMAIDVYEYVMTLDTMKRIKQSHLRELLRMMQTVEAVDARASRSIPLHNSLAQQKRRLRIVLNLTDALEVEQVRRVVADLMMDEQSHDRTLTLAA